MTKKHIDIDYSFSENLDRGWKRNGDSKKAETSMIVFYSIVCGIFLLYFLTHFAIHIIANWKFYSFLITSR